MDLQHGLTSLSAPCRVPALPSMGVDPKHPLVSIQHPELRSSFPEAPVSDGDPAFLFPSFSLSARITLVSLPPDLQSLSGLRMSLIKTLDSVPRKCT